MILAIDESGISHQPTRVHTWALKGQSPVVSFHFNWDHVSMIASMHQGGFTFHLHHGAIRKEEVVAFLKALQAHYRCKLLILWDNLKSHRSHLVQDYVQSTHGQIVIAYFPAYAPELNPIEYLWAWLKHHALANYCPDTLTELQHGARTKLQSAQRRPSIVTACWSQAELF